MSKLCVFVVGDGELESDQDIVVAKQHDYGSVMDYYRSNLSWEPPSQVVIRQCGVEVLMTSYGETKAEKVSELIDYVEATGIEIPACVGVRHGMKMYEIGCYGIVAENRKEALKLLMDVAPTDYFMEVLKLLREADEYEPGCGAEDPDPILPMHPKDIVTINNVFPLTATIEKHVEWAAARKGIWKAHLLYVHGNDGVMYETPELAAAATTASAV